MSESVAGPRRRRAWVPLVVSLLLIGVGVAVVVGCYSFTSMQSQTMGPGLAGADTLALAPVEGSDDVRAGDVVALRPPWLAEAAPAVVFRVLGEGGDRIEGSADGTISLNGDVVDEPYLAGASRDQPFSVVVPAAHVFVAGDSRSVSNDSRLNLDVGAGSVPLAAVEGRVVGVLWPAWHWHVVDSSMLDVVNPETASGRGTPLPFVAGSASLALGVLTGLVAATRQVRRVVDTRRERR